MSTFSIYMTATVLTLIGILINFTNSFQRPNFSDKQINCDIIYHLNNLKFCQAECLSDYHHIVYTVKRGRINLPKPRWIIFDDPDDVNWAYTRMITDVIDRHAPLKRKRRRAEEAPYMNSTYRKAIRLKTKLRSEFFKMKTPTNWELYRKQRNLCTSMRRQAVKTYFLERCERGPKNTDFWHIYYDH